MPIIVRFQPGFSRSSTLSRLVDPAPVLLLVALGAETRVEVLHVPVAVPRGAQHEVHVGRAAVNLEVVAAHLCSQVGRGPHTDAPAGARVGSAADGLLPVPPLLARDLPKGALGAAHRVLHLHISKSRSSTSREKRAPSPTLHCEIF